MADSLYLPKKRYVLALKRQRERIVNGLPFFAEDSEAIGAKSTEASWGLCTRAKEAWPDAEDHLWPDLFINNGRVAPKYRRHRCPMDQRNGSHADGCFYHCRVFKRQIKSGDRAKVVEAYDQQIAKETA